MSKIKKERKVKVLARVKRVLTIIEEQIYGYNTRFAIDAITHAEEKGETVDSTWYTIADSLNVEEYNKIWITEVKKEFNLKHLPEYTFKKGYRNLIYDLDEEFVYEMEVVNDMLILPKFPKVIKEWLTLENLKVYRYSKDLINIHSVDVDIYAKHDIEYHFSYDKEGKVLFSAVQMKTTGYSTYTYLSKKQLQGIIQVIDYLENHPEIRELT